MKNSHFDRTPLYWQNVVSDFVAIMTSFLELERGGDNLPPSSLYCPSFYKKERSKIHHSHLNETLSFEWDTTVNWWYKGAQECLVEWIQWGVIGNALGFRFEPCSIYTRTLLLPRCHEALRDGECTLDLGYTRGSRLVDRGKTQL